MTKFNVIQKQGGEQYVDQTAEQVRERLNSVKATTLSTVQAKVSSVLTLPDACTTRRIAGCPPSLTLLHWTLPTPTRLQDLFNVVLYLQ